MVTMPASTAAHTGFALRRRTTTKTSTANGIATSPSRNMLGAGTSRSITSGSNGVSMPLTSPPAAIFRRSLRDLSAVIASVNVHPVRSGKTGAGEGNRTLLCSLGSWAVVKHYNHLDAKPGLTVVNALNGLEAQCKTVWSPHDRRAELREADRCVESPAISSLGDVRKTAHRHLSELTVLAAPKKETNP